tara:strand:+ start:8689 stop:8907 length:219 start_codon:yes stop_codon:yes gene_type:complete
MDPIFTDKKAMLTLVVILIIAVVVGFLRDLLSGVIAFVVLLVIFFLVRKFKKKPSDEDLNMRQEFVNEKQNP